MLFVLMFSLMLMAQDNVLRNGEFDDGRRSWSVKNYNDAELEYDFPTDSVMSGPASCRIAITKGGAKEDVLVYQSVTLS